MNKSKRTFSIAYDLSSALDQLHKRQGDHTWHVEQALRAYPPIKKLLKATEQGKKFLAETGYKSVLDMPAKFTPPSYADVCDYFLEQGEMMPRQAQSEGSAFIDFYGSKGWMVGKNKMKDWKAAVRNWMRKRNENGQRSNSQSQGTNKPSLEQRSAEEVRRSLAIIEREEAGHGTLAPDEAVVSTQMGVDSRADTGR